MTRTHLLLPLLVLLLAPPAALRGQASAFPGQDARRDGPPVPPTLWSLQATASVDPGRIGDSLGAELAGLGLRIETRLPSRVAPYLAAAYLDRGLRCDAGEACGGAGVRASLGLNFPFASATDAPLQPYAGGGIGGVRWSGGDWDLVGRGHVGIDWRVGPVGLRTEAGYDQAGWFLAGGLLLESGG